MTDTQSVDAEAFLAIEAALAKTMNSAILTRISPVLEKVDAALVQGNRDLALSELGTLSLADLVGSVKGLRTYTAAGFTFGLSQLVPPKSNSSIDLKDHIHEMDQAEELTGRILAYSGTPYIITLLHGMVTQGHELKVETPTCLCGDAHHHPLLFKADKLKGFQSFKKEDVETAADALARLTSSLHTSRVTSLGFVAQAEYLKLTEYAVSEQLDRRICPVCKVMHGRVFKVAELRRAVNQILAVDDPNDLKVVQPWPKQTKANVQRIAGASAEELSRENLHLPPYHPLCRGLTVSTTSVHDLEATASMQEAISENGVLAHYIPTPWDFVALGKDLPIEVVDTWAAALTMSPRKLIGGVLGLDPQLITADMLTKKGISFEVTEYGVSVSANVKGAGMDYAKKVQVSVDFSSKEGTITPAGAQTGGDFETSLKHILITLWKAGVPSVTVEATGGSWGKFGFIPDAGAWGDMASTALTRFRKIANNYPASFVRDFESLLTSQDARVFPSLWSVGGTVNGTPLIENLIKGVSYTAKAVLTDPIVQSSLV